MSCVKQLVMESLPQAASAPFTMSESFQPEVSWKRLDDAIDSVVMVTSSDWKTEPRSNRYHFATRFARCVPVFFVQPDSTSDKIWLEALPQGIKLLHVPARYGSEDG